jgi:hypothetical protein
MMRRHEPRLRYAAVQMAFPFYVFRN